ncbi:hypothetical protein CCHL11_04821 [Colletotrichum chlorophyti]|uniref:Uncharacterized protein n=1 Tax=Colletotrichum chlorophyti TaxID=708187 RepID=A0A1Q8S2L4_9PEZI|nr:hypothetical protein CCHL11_04821 [Colletotrichum chlorophyti]
MAVQTESPAQFERDLRSAHRDFKRDKDSRSKWSNGARPLAGCRLDYVTMEAIGGSEEQCAKTRPRGRQSEFSHNKKAQHNMTKFRSHWDLPDARVKAAAGVKEQIKDPLSQSLVDLVPVPGGRRNQGVSEDWMYSFDKNESPGRPLTLDVFVKTNGRDTERMVEKEYEILNENGQVLKGRKARQNLRHEQLGVAEDDGFQLV